MIKIQDPLIRHKIENVIDTNYDEFSKLDPDSEVLQISLEDTEGLKEYGLTPPIVSYLKTIERFDYRGVCIYYVKDDNEIWIELL